MTSRIFIIALWASVGGLAIGEAVLSKTYKVNLFSYIICWVMLMFELFYDYILKA